MGCWRPVPDARAHCDSASGRPTEHGGEVQPRAHLAALRRACTGLARRIRLGRVHAVARAQRRTTQRRCPRLPLRWFATCGRHPWHKRRLSKAGDLRGGRIGARRTRSARRVPDLEHRYHRTGHIVDRLCACGVAVRSVGATSGVRSRCRAFRRARYERLGADGRACVSDRAVHVRSTLACSTSRATRHRDLGTTPPAPLLPLRQSR